MVGVLSSDVHEVRIKLVNKKMLIILMISFILFNFYGSF